MDPPSEAFMGGDLSVRLVMPQAMQSAHPEVSRSFFVLVIFSHNTLQASVLIQVA